MPFLFTLAMLASAGEKLAPVTGNITVLGEASPIGLERPIQLEEARDPEPPVVYSPEAQKAYDKEVEAYLDLRADFKAIDAEIAALSPAIAACASTAGVAPGAKATARVTVANTGKVGRVAPDKTADPALATCVRSTLEKYETAGILHGKDRSAPWTFHFRSAPPAVPNAIDATIGVAGLAFGSPVDQLDNRANSASHGNISHYYRTNDDNAELAGVPIGIAFSFHPDVGFYAARIRATGDSATFTVREHTTGRLGPPQWDGQLKCWYWRGEHVVYVFEGARGSPVGQLLIMDMDRAKAAKVVAFLPGDTESGELAPGQKIPKVLLDQAGD